MLTDVQPEACIAAISVLAHRRDTAANFGNGGEVDNLLREAKGRKEQRRTDNSAAARMDNELVSHITAASCSTLYMP
jgi:AAA lid domain